MSKSTFIRNGRLLTNANGSQIYDSLAKLQYCCGCCNILKMIRERQIAAGFAGVNLIDMTGETEYTLSQLIYFVNLMAPKFLSAPWSGGLDYPVGLPATYADGAADEDELWGLILAMGDKTIVENNLRHMLESYHVVSDNPVPPSVEGWTKSVTDAYNALYVNPGGTYGYGAMGAIVREWNILPGLRTEIFLFLTDFNPDIDFTGAVPCSLEIYSRAVDYVGGIATGLTFDKQGFTVPDENVYGWFATEPSDSSWTTGIRIDMRAAVGSGSPLSAPPNWTTTPPDLFQTGFGLDDWFAIGTWIFQCTDVLEGPTPGP